MSIKDTPDSLRAAEQQRRDQIEKATSELWGNAEYFKPIADALSELKREMEANPVVSVWISHRSGGVALRRPNDLPEMNVQIVCSTRKELFDVIEDDGDVDDSGKLILYKNADEAIHILLSRVAAVLEDWRRQK